MRLKIFLFTLMILIFTSKTFAAMPDIQSGESRFDFFSGCYIFQNNVRVSDRGMTATAQKAVASMINQKVWASGGVTYQDSEIKFSCEKIFVRASDNIVEVIGKLNFNDGAVKIIGDVGTYSWKNKFADFYGKVKLTANKNISVDSNLNVKKINGTYAHVRYNIVEKKIIALDKTFDNIPAQNYSEPDPTE